MIRRNLFSVIATVIIIMMMAGCKKDDDKILNQLTIAGNSTAEYNGDYIPEDGHYYGPYEVQCVNTTYGSYIWIDLSSNAVLRIEMILPSDATALPEGTYSPSPGECEDGFYAVFYPNYYGAKNGGLVLSSGTVKIDKQGSDYSVDVNLGIHSLSGGGTLKGNFFGPLPMIQNGIK